MRRLDLLVAAIVALAWAGPAVFSQTAGDTATAQLARQDGRQIERLEWHAPPGELPGKYTDYLKWHPRTPAAFSESRMQGRALAADISILVDETLYPSIATSLGQYIADIQADGQTVFLQTVSGGTPEEIKSWVAGQFSTGSEGIVFVGDITAAWAEVLGSQFPSDLFYMDLDGNWEDNNSDGIYEVHTAGTGDMAPEVYIGRMYAHTLSYAGEAQMVNDYLAKCAAYRRYELTQPWRGLEYVDEDWYSMSVNLDVVYGDSVVRYDHGYNTTGADYLDQMDLGQHFVQVCAHSYSGGHHFGTRPTESAVYAHVYVHSPTARAARLLLGSDDGIRVWLNGAHAYTNDRYGDWYEDAYPVSVSLLAGWNRLLCKVSQGGGDCRLSVRITDASYVTFSDLGYQINDPNTYPTEAPFVRGWLLNGFHSDHPDNFYSYINTNYLGVTESAVNPTAGEITAGKTWTTTISGGPFVDMTAHEDQDYGVCYAFARVYADSAMSCQLWLGSDDGIRAWLNGAQILYDNRYGTFEVDRSKVPVSLSAGENRLLVKVTEWMGTHGFSARFCHADGSPVEGLNYDPVATPIAHIGTWLLSGPYPNANTTTRLTTDYLGDEAGVVPSQGEPTPLGIWERCLDNGRPLEIAAFYDAGDWVYSATIQERDPPVLFYNLFSCGPGRFTDDDYLAGAYIFNTTTGLITVASAKSGSMLNFQDFTGPLSQDMTIGQAYLAWFETQAPFELWEQEWYYGMVLNGDPTLRLLACVDADGDGYGDPGVAFNSCPVDNCPDTPNPAQIDSDGDGVGDVCDILCGDANLDAQVSVADILHLVNHCFKGGVAPIPACLGDCNVDGVISTPDILYLVGYVLKSGPPPLDPCCT